MNTQELDNQLREVANCVLEANIKINEAINIIDSQMEASFSKSFKRQGGISLGGIHMMLRLVSEKSPESLPIEFQKLFTEAPPKKTKN